MQNTSSFKIDVVIPAYNASKYIAETIQSVLEQTLLPHKIIIVDDGSTDNTLEIVKGFNNDLIEVLSVPNGGVSRARNIGIRASKAEYIAFLDADDLWAVDKLAAQAKTLAANPAKKAVYSYAIMINETGAATENAPSYKNIPYPPGKLHEKLLFEFVNISGSASSVMVETKILKSTELFDEKMNFAEDIDLWLRLALLTDFELVAKNHVKIRVNTSSSTRSLSWKSQKKMITDHFYFMNKYANDYQIPKETIRISLTYLVTPFVKKPHRIVEYFLFCKQLKNMAPSYFKQILVNDGNMIKLLFISILLFIIQIYKRAKFIDRTKLLLSEGTIYFSKSKKYNPDVEFIRKKR